MFRLVLLGVVFLMSFIFISCENMDDSKSVPYDFNACDAGYVFDGDLCVKSDEIKDKTLVITTGEIDNLLTNFEADRLVFDKTDRTSKFKEGQIIAFGKSEKFNKGYVAEINTVEETNNKVIIHTSIISPILAFKHLKLDIKKIITADPKSELFKNPTEEQLRKFSDQHHVYEPSKEYSKTFSFEQTWEPTYGTVTLTGSLVFSDLIEVKADIFEKEVTGFNDYYLDELTFKNTLGINIDIGLTAESKNLEPALKRFNGKLFRKTFKLAEVPITVSGITFRIRFDLTTRGDLASSLQGKASASESSHNTLMVGVSYKRRGAPRGTQFLHKFTSDNHLHGSVEIEGKASATLGLIPSMTIYAYTEKLFSVNGKVDVRITPLEITSHLSASTDIGNDRVQHNKVRACYRADGKLTASPSITVKAIKKLTSRGFVLEKTFSFSPKEKAWSWIDFLTSGGYFGPCSSGCHEGLECVSDRNGATCRAKSFWSKVGHTDDTEYKPEYGLEEGWKCSQLVCNTDEDCRISKQTVDATCESSKCVYKPKSTSYEMISIGATSSFKRGCVDGDEECKGKCASGSGAWCHGSVEFPVKDVTLKAYKIGKKEVTNSQYKKCVAAGFCHAPYGSPTYNDSSKASYPITNIKFSDATRFCGWLGGYRLPTEAEWEYAAKGTSNKKFPWGDENPTCEKTTLSGLHYLDRNDNNKPTFDPDYTSCTEGTAGCVSCTGSDGCFDGFHKAQNPVNPKYGSGCSTGGPKSVSSNCTSGKDRSPFGLCNMAGNVSEWVKDYYSSDYYDSRNSTNNPQGPTSSTNYLISVRGGSYLNSTSYLKTSLTGQERKVGGTSFRSSSRSSRYYGAPAPNIGFRCAASK